MTVPEDGRPDGRAGDAPAGHGPNPFTELLGGKGQALDATVPSVAFVVGWLGAGALGAAQPVLPGGLLAVVVAGGVALWRQRREPGYTMTPALPPTARPFRPDLHAHVPAREGAA